MSSKAKAKSVEQPKAKSVEQPKAKSVEQPKAKNAEQPKAKAPMQPKGKAMEQPQGYPKSTSQQKPPELKGKSNQTSPDKKQDLSLKNKLTAQNIVSPPHTPPHVRSPPSPVSHVAIANQASFPPSPSNTPPNY
ncbi:MAG: hypothetical protein EZS28_005543 [Streblomastix strix]|uniref:Uncharacterized protein n=1 Tax=Streblomastix strix TaxID=222440 RepID=A0A5J4WV64_9EUKA|nr:MAG: hypothetical protein EZS28_005543 [Streblomastix strix]